MTTVAPAPAAPVPAPLPRLTDEDRTYLDNRKLPLAELNRITEIGLMHAGAYQGFLETLRKHPDPTAASDPQAWVNASTNARQMAIALELTRDNVMLHFPADKPAGFSNSTAYLGYIRNDARTSYTRAADAFRTLKDGAPVNPAVLHSFTKGNDSFTAISASQVLRLANRMFHDGGVD